MALHSVYDTPPNGDFASYVEALGRESAARLLQANAAHPAVAAAHPAHATPAQRAAPPRTGKPAAAVTPPQAPPPQAIASLRGLAMKAVVLWVAYSVGSALFPSMAWLGWPLLCFFVVSAWPRLKALPWPALAQAAAQQAERKKRPR